MVLTGLAASSAQAQSTVWSDGFTTGTDFSFVNPTNGVDTTGGRRVFAESVLGTNTTSLTTGGSGGLSVSMTGYSTTNIYYGTQNSSNPAALDISAPAATSNFQLVFTSFSAAPPTWLAVDLYDDDNSLCRYSLSNADLATLTGTNGGALSLPLTSFNCIVAGAVPGFSGVVDGMVISFDDPQGNASFGLDELRITGTAFPSGSLTATATFSAANGGTDAQTLTVSNDAGATGSLDVNAIAVSGANASSFTLGTAATSPCAATPFSLSAGQSCNVLVTFAPAASESPGSMSASLDVSSNNGSALSASLSGTVTSNASVTISPSSASFAPTVVNQTSPALTFTVTNGLAAQLNGLSASLSGADAGMYTITGGTCGSTLAGNSSCTVIVTFAPTGTISAATATAATLRVASSNSSTLTVSLSGLTGASTAQIPTLSEWGMIVMAVLLMGSMFVAMKRKGVES